MKLDAQQFADLTYKLSREECIAIATQFRAAWRKAGGIVLIWDGAAYGWKNCLRNPEHEVPGVVAVDEHGNLWLAVGGNPQDGAEIWIPWTEVGRDEKAATV